MVIAINGSVLAVSCSTKVYIKICICYVGLSMVLLEHKDAIFGLIIYFATDNI